MSNRQSKSAQVTAAIMQPLSPNQSLFLRFAGIVGMTSCAMTAIICKSDPTVIITLSAMLAALFGVEAKHFITREK